MCVFGVFEGFWCFEGVLIGKWGFLRCFWWDMGVFDGKIGVFHYQKVKKNGEKCIFL